MLGTTAANAVLDFTPEAGVVRLTPAVTYARETLAEKVDTDSSYYVIDGGADTLELTAKLGVAGGGGPTDDVIVIVTLDGMVFTDTSIRSQCRCDTRNSAMVSRSAGGTKGDDFGHLCRQAWRSMPQREPIDR